LTDDRAHWQAQAGKLATTTSAGRVCWRSPRNGRTGPGAPRSAAGTLAAGRGEARCCAGGGQSRAHRDAQAEQRLHVEQANRGHAQRSLQIVASRRERLALERQAMPVPDDAAFADKQEELAELA
jgi:hypothetical protein